MSPLRERGGGEREKEREKRRERGRRETERERGRREREVIRFLVLALEGGIIFGVLTHLNAADPLRGLDRKSTRLNSSH